MAFWRHVARNKPFLVGIFLGIVTVLLAIYVEFHPYDVTVLGSGTISPLGINSSISFTVPPSSIVVVQLGNESGNVTVSYYRIVPDTSYVIPGSVIINSTAQYHFFTMVTNMTLSNASAPLNYKVYELNRSYIFWALLWTSLILFIITVVLVIFGFSQITSEIYREKLKNKKR